MRRRIRYVRWPELLVVAVMVTAGLSSAPAVRGQAMPIAVTGWNADVVLDADMSSRYAITMDNGSCCFYEAGALDDAGTERDDGLPAGQTFVSATGSGTVYQLQPAKGNNALQLYH